MTKKNTELNVLSLFDGISCGQLALQRAGFNVKNYFASEIDKPAIKVTQHNFPNTIQLGDVRNIDLTKLPKIDLLIGGSPCFVSDTLILTKNGYKEICDVEVDDLVLSHTGNWRKVVNIGSSFNYTRIVSGYGNIGLETTDDHPFLAKKMYKEYDKNSRALVRKFDVEKWIDAKELCKSDYVATVKSPEVKTKMDYNFWYMIGRYTGDGWYRKQKENIEKNSFIYQFIVCCGKQDFEYLKNKFDLFGYNYNFSEERTVYKFSVCCMDLVEFVEPIGKGASNKKIHPNLFSESKENIHAFIDGYLESDGYYNKKTNSYSISTTSKYLAYGIQQLISSCLETPVSMYYRVRPSTCIIEGRTVNQKNSYELKFKKDKRKQDNAFFEDIYSWMPVKNNTITNEIKQVYNLEVDIDNSYTANNIVVHNCQNFSMIGKRTGMSTKCNIQITTLEQYLNLKNENFEFEGQSYLFWEYVHTMHKLKEINPNIKFLLENVVMKKEYLNVLNTIIGCEPIKINSSLVSGQSRNRLYWTNIASNITLPADKNIQFFDLIQKDVLGNYTDVYINHKKQQNRWGNHIGKSEDYKIKKHPCLLKIGKCDTLLIEDFRRFITPIEAERLQTLPDNYTSNISESARFAAIGNGWTVDVIVHILNHMII